MQSQPPGAASSPDGSTANPQVDPISLVSPEPPAASPAASAIKQPLADSSRARKPAVLARSRRPPPSNRQPGRQLQTFPNRVPRQLLRQRPPPLPLRHRSSSSSNRCRALRPTRQQRLKPGRSPRPVTIQPPSPSRPAPARWRRCPLSSRRRQVIGPRRSSPEPPVFEKAHPAAIPG